MRGVLPIVSLGLCAIGLVAFYRGEARREAELDALRAELKAMRTTANVAGELAKLKLPAPVIVPAPAPVRPAAPDEPAQPAAGPRTQPEAPSAGELDARVALAFAGQRVDPDWSGRTERTLEQSVGAVLPQGSRLRGVACRASLCRLELEHPSEAALDRFREEALFGAHVVWRGAVYETREPTASGGFVTVAYLARDDGPLL